jgi:hypothetical protein
MSRTIGDSAQNAVAGQAHLPENDPDPAFMICLEIFRAVM